MRCQINPGFAYEKEPGFIELVYNKLGNPNRFYGATYS